MAEERAPSPGGGAETQPESLLKELTALRRRTRADRHAYWFPLLLFGLLGCGAAPLYATGASPGRPGAPVAAGTARLTGPVLLSGPPWRASSFYIGWYWTIALVGGCVLTLAWYRRHTRRRGVQARATGFVVTGVALTVLAFAAPPLAAHFAWLPLPPAQMWARGTLAFALIAAGFWALAWAERSPALAVTTLLYSGAATLASLYNVENALYRLGWSPGPGALGLTALPNVLLPAVVLLAGGLAALAGRRRLRRA